MKRVLIGAPVRQDHTTFYKYLKAMNQLDTNGIEVDFFFILHNSPRLKRFLKPSQYIEYTSNNEYIRDQISHHWTVANLSDVANMKNFLLAVARDYDYFFLVDSDIILQSDTLQRLMSHQKDIVAQCFWTEWTQNSEPMPNAWIADFYSFAFDNQWRHWHKEGLFAVGGTGACILISNNVLKNDNVSYTPIPNVTYSNWEDRAFCIRASVCGYEMYLDTRNCPQHLYRQKDMKPQHNKKKQAHQTK